MGESPEKLARRRELYQVNKEKLQKKGRAWHAKNRERSRANSDAWKAANPEKNACAVRARRATPYGKARQLLNTAAYKSRQTQRPFDLTHEHLEALLHEALALGIVTCESNRPDTASIDQIIPAAGYVQGNVQIVPWWYNAAKHDFAAADLHAAMSNWRLIYG